MRPAIVGWAPSLDHRTWHAVRADGRAACGPTRYLGAPTRLPPGAKVCQRIGCYNAQQEGAGAAPAEGDR